MSAHIIAVFGKLQIPSYPRIQERYLSQSKILKILLSLSVEVTDTEFNTV